MENFSKNSLKNIEVSASLWYDRWEKREKFLLFDKKLQSTKKREECKNE